MTAIYALIGMSLMLPLLLTATDQRQSTLLAKSQPKNCLRSATEDEEF